MSAPADPVAAPESESRDRSMLLLRRLVEDSLDQGYVDAAARRRADRSEPGAPGGRNDWRVLGIGLALVGLLLATAFAQTRERSGSVAQARDRLGAEIESRTAANDRLADQLARDRKQVLDAQRRALRVTTAGTRLAVSLAALGAATGTGAVVGPGMVVRLDDAGGSGGIDGGADADPRTDPADGSRVTDRDLQTVVNEVWAAGAEAVAVNGQRLTALSAIRSAGEAILVDFRPLRPPYRIAAVGDPGSLRTDFVDGFGGSYLQVLTDYGISYDVADRDRLTLPASAGVDLRFATAPVRSGGINAGNDSSDEGTAP